VSKLHFVKCRSKIFEGKGRQFCCFPVTKGLIPSFMTVCSSSSRRLESCFLAGIKQRKLLLKKKKKKKKKEERTDIAAAEGRKEASDRYQRQRSVGKGGSARVPNSNFLY
jgi:hypothetical protein